MKRLITFIFLFVSAPSSAQIDGKGLFCPFEGYEVSLHGFPTRNFFRSVYFNDGMAHLGRPDIHQDEVKILTESEEPYKINAKTITWTTWKVLAQTNFTLDRETLILTNNNDPELKCEIFRTKTAYDNKLKQVTELLQSEFNEFTKENKI